MRSPPAKGRHTQNRGPVRGRFSSSVRRARPRRLQLNLAEILLQVNFQKAIFFLYTQDIVAGVGSREIQGRTAVRDNDPARPGLDSAVVDLVKSRGSEKVRFRCQFLFDRLHPVERARDMAWQTVN